MSIKPLLLGVLAAGGISFAGCKHDDEGPGDLNRELESVEQIDPEPEVEVTPGGEVDVELQPQPAE